MKTTKAKSSSTKKKPKTSSAPVPTATVAQSGLFRRPTPPITLTNSLGQPVSVAVTADGAKAYASSLGDSWISVIDATTSKVTKIIPISQVAIYPFTLAIGPNGKQVCALIPNGFLAIDTQTDAISSVAVAGAADPQFLFFSADSATVYLVDVNGAFFAVEIATGQVLASGGISKDDRPSGAAMTPDGKKVYISSESNIYMLDSQGQQVAALPFPYNPGPIAITPDGTKAYFISGDSNVVCALSTVTNQVVASIACGQCPARIAITPDGTKVYVTNSQDFTVTVISTATDTVQAVVPVLAYPVNLAISPNGKYVAVANVMSSETSLISTATDQVVGNVPAGEYTSSVAFSGDSSAVFSTSLIEGRVYHALLAQVTSKSASRK